EMLAATADACDDADALASVAAIGDYTLESSAEKIRSGQELTLELEPTPKLIDEIRAAHPDLAIVGFKTETSGDDEAMVDRARETIARTDLEFVVANDASVMGSDRTRALLVREEETTPYTGSKTGLGLEIADSLAAALET
ncbi:phosphopantothenoylcysteine decarboxylase, partial [Natronococcus sp.]|uniref:phosphopantothenoylcysteine decarboxylase domain-containing protein n=1 Tax=Natronococcus sp. TaxID=35747 RepID=UPI003A4E3D86